MDVQDKHRVTLLNAKCEVVCKAQSMLKKMDYGEEIDNCCSEKLFAAIKLINRLDCYCFNDIITGDVEVLSVFTLTLPNTILFTGVFVSIKINGEQVVSKIITADEELLPSVIESLLIQAGITYTRNGLIFTITSSCNTLKIKAVRISSNSFSNTVVSTSAVNTVAGVCTTNGCYNCISDSDLPKVYAVLNTLLQ